MNLERPDAEEAQAVELTPKEPGKAAREGQWSDREIASEKEDRFSSQDYAKVLAERAKKADTPLTIGIYGRWGSGKTSLMRLIEAVLPKETEGGGKLRSIWINVWELSTQEEVWHAFLQALFNQVHRKLPLWQRIDKGKLLKQLATNSYRIVLVITPMILGVLIAKPDAKWGDVLQLLANSTAAWAGTLMTIGLGLWALVKPIIEAARETVNFDLEAVLKYQPYEVQITELMRLRKQFEDMVETWVGEQGRLVVFIDDLDRCTPDKVPEVLEAIKLFTTTRRCVYVLGLDHDIVRQGIETKYEFPESEGAAEYLEKIVQIPFHLPPLDEGRMENFIDADYDVCPTAPDVFSRGLEPNPRKVKRALNVYRTLLKLADVRVDAWEMDPVDPELVAKMVVIEGRFRPLHRHLVKEPEFLVKLDECLPETEVGTALKDDELIQALEKDGEVCRVLIGEADAKSGLVDRDSLGALVATLLAGKKRFKDQPLDQIRSYIYLIATTEGGAEQIRPSREQRQALLGGDPARIEKLVKQIQEQGATQTYVDRLEVVPAELDRGAG
jgi:energy-coupling factor transporter ATP-binding protein EcfA2